MEMRGMMGGFYKLSEWIMRLAVTNLLWLLCSLPFWFFGFWAYLVSGNAAGAGDEAAVQSVLQTLLIAMAIVSPFTFFPATSAMFSVARKWVTGDADVPLLKTFFRNYKQNFKQAMIGGLLYALLFAVLIIDFRVYLTRMTGFQFIAYLFVALTIVLIVSLHHFFSLLSHFHMKTSQLIKNALVLTVGRPFRSVAMTLGTLAVLYISFFTRFSFLIPFFFGSLIAAYTYYNFNLMIGKMMEKAGQPSGGGTDGVQEEDQETKS